MNSKPNRALQIITSVFALFYLFFVVMATIHDSYPLFKTFSIFEALLMLFISGFILCWFNKYLISGVLFMVWNIVVWLSDLYFNRPEQDYSMMSAMASIFMLIGAFFVLEWYNNSKETIPTEKLQWKFILRVIMVNYVILYAIVVFSEITVGEPANYLSYPYLIYPLLFILFLIGFVISWKKEIVAGFLFLLWFAILIITNFTYSEVSQLGGWALFGLPLLLQGIFYINNHYKFKTN